MSTNDICSLCQCSLVDFVRKVLDAGCQTRNNLVLTYNQQGQLEIATKTDMNTS